MALERLGTLADYLRILVITFDNLEAEKQALLLAGTRIPQIDAEKAEIFADTANALADFNAEGGTGFTIAEIQARFRSPPPGSLP